MRKIALPNVFGVVLVIFITGVGLLCSAQSLLKFSQIVKSATNGLVYLTIDAPVNNIHRLQVSQDLYNWVDITTFAVSAGTLRYTDGAAPFLAQQFYRAQQLPTTNVIWGDHIQTDSGDVVIQPINHATFVMSWGTNILYFDPINAASRYAHLPKATVLFITHQHSDHYSYSTITNVITDRTKIIVSRIVWQQSSFAPLTNRAILLTNWASTTVNGIYVEAIPAYNLTTQNHLKGDGNGYVLTIGNKRFYISGDTEDIPEMRALQNIDVAFLAMNKPYTMSVDQASSAARAFKPKIVYPFHYYPSSPAPDLEAFKNALIRDGIEVRLRKWY